METLGLMIQQKIDVHGRFLYHWRCEETRLFQLSFADDLLLFCQADETSIRIFKEGLDDFSSLSGIHTNAAKSQALFSKAAQPFKNTIISILGFQEGPLPVNTLDFHLLPRSSPSMIAHPLLIKIDKRLQGWASIRLSFAARIQLIKSVLMSLQIYWAMAFILPKGVIKEIEKRFRQFLWKGESSLGYPKVSWNQVCRPLEEGGQGIMDVGALNPTLMSRHIWRIVSKSPSSIWVTWICTMRLQGKSSWIVEANSGSWGSLVSYGILLTIFPHGPYHTHTRADMLLREVIHNGIWHWPQFLTSTHTRGDVIMLNIIHNLPPIQGTNDSITLRGGPYTNRRVYDIFRSSGPKVDWYSLLMGPFKIPRNSFILWPALQKRLSTMDRTWLQQLNSDCVLCSLDTLETHQHLLFSCHYSKQCIRILYRKVRFSWTNRGWMIDGMVVARKWRGKHVVNASYRNLLASLVYHIWQEPNRRKFQQLDREPSALANIILDEIRLRILSEELPNTISTIALYRL
ncbi:UNVERIFIED_CONTAM: hypothetical protein Sindi_2233300 [Sesamum indicum]